MMIDPGHSQIGIERQCELVGLSRSSYYYQGKGEDEYNLQLMRLIDEQYTRRPILGVRRMTDYLRRLGHVVNHKRVARLMRLMGLSAIYPKPKTSISSKLHQKYPYLLRGLEIDRPNQVWCTDVTYGVPGVYAKQQCLDEPRVYLKYKDKLAQADLSASMPGCAGI